jgi:hypothetical protein
MTLDESLDSQSLTEIVVMTRQNSRILGPGMQELSDEVGSESI